MKKLAIIGAGYNQLPLVLEAGKMDLETICFAWEEGAVCANSCTKFYPISILEKEKILSICNQEKIDGIASIASDAAVPTLSFVAENLGLISNCFADAEKCTNKYAMRRRFEEKGMNTPRYVLSDIGQATGLRDLIFPLIVKPVDRSGSRGVLKINRSEELPEAIERARNESFIHNAIIEEFIEGEEVSVESISWEGRHYILAVTDKVNSGEPYFVELAHHQPSQLDTDVKEKITSETIKALNALNIIYGAGHSEFKVTPQGEIFCIEVGARMGGDFIGSHLVKLSTGYDFVRGVIEVALGSFTIPVFTEDKYSGVFFLSEETRHIRQYIKDNNHNFIILSAFLDSEIRPVRNTADRSGYLIYQSGRRIYL